MARKKTAKRAATRSTGSRSKKVKKKQGARKKAAKKKAKKSATKKATKKKVAKKTAKRKTAKKKKKTAKKKAVRKTAAKRKTGKKKVAKKKAPKRTRKPSRKAKASKTSEKRVAKRRGRSSSAESDGWKDVASSSESALLVDEPVVQDAVVVHLEPDQEPTSSELPGLFAYSEAESASAAPADDEWDFAAPEWMENLVKDESADSVPAPKEDVWEATLEGLFSAAERGDLESVRTLVEAGADVMIRDWRPATRGMTAAMIAGQGGHGAVVRLLLEAGADPDATDDPDNEHCFNVHFLRHQEFTSEVDLNGMRLGRTACHLAASRGQTDVVRALIEHGGDVDLADHTGMTPLMISAQAGHLTLARLLIQSGAQVDAQDLERSNALLIASRAGNGELLRLLIDSGADVDARNDMDCTPLMAAVSRARADAARILLRSNADVAAQDHRGFGVLSFALHAVECYENEMGQEAVRPVGEERVLELVQILLEAGADDRPDGTGVRPSQRADELGYEDVAATLRERGYEDHLLAS